MLIIINHSATRTVGKFTYHNKLKQLGRWYDIFTRDNSCRITTYITTREREHFLEIFQMQVDENVLP